MTHENGLLLLIDAFMTEGFDAVEEKRYYYLRGLGELFEVYKDCYRVGEGFEGMKQPPHQMLEQGYRFIYTCNPS